MAIEFTQFQELVKISPLGNLPNEVMIDILLRLPVKSICRFKCASKPWKALFTNESFVELHLARVLSLNSEYLLLRHLANPEEEYFTLEWDDSTREMRKRKVPAHRKRQLRTFAQSRAGMEAESSEDPKEVISLRSKETLEELLKVQVPSGSLTGYYTVVDSCNGLVCLTESNEEGLVPFLNAFLWNPATREFRTLPRYYMNNFTGQVTTAGFGFIFHPVKKDYLVVRIVYLRESKSFEVDIYSLSTDQWKTTSVDLKYYFQESLSQVFMNNSFHWLVTKEGNVYTCQDYFALSFDIDEEKFAEVRLPEGHLMNEFLLHKTTNGQNTSSELLSLIICKPYEVYDSWVLTEYGNAESWVKLYSVRLFTGELVKPRHVLDANRILAERDLDGELVVCDSEFRIMNDLQVFNPSRVVRHIESLVSPHQGNEDSRHRNWYIPRD